MIASFIFWYLGCFEPPKNGQNRPIELLQKSKSCTNPPNSLQIPLFPPKFAACGLFWCRANSNHVFFTMTSHNTVKYCPNTAKLQELSKNDISRYFSVNHADLMCIGIFISLDQVKWEPARKILKAPNIWPEGNPWKSFNFNL